MSEQELNNNNDNIASEATTPDDQPVEPAAEVPASEMTVAETEATEPAAIETPAASSSPEAEASDEDATPGSIFDLKTGLKLPGKVKTITDFGAFIDLGIAQDGLVHVSELTRGRVENVGDVVSVGDEVTVWIKKVDKRRGRISLTMVKPIVYRWRDLKEGAVVTGKITRLESYGAFVDIEAEREGLIHVSELTHDFIQSPEDVVSVGDQVTVKILKVDRKKRQIDLSMKALLPLPQAQQKVEEAAVVEEDEIVEEEATPTAMALAFQAARGDLPESAKVSGKRGKSKGKTRKQKDLDRLLHRTLENHPS